MKKLPLQAKHMHEILHETEEEAPLFVIIHGVAIPVTGTEDGVATENNPYGILFLKVGEDNG